MVNLTWNIWWPSWIRQPSHCEPQMNADERGWPACRTHPRSSAVCFPNENLGKLLAGDLTDFGVLCLLSDLEKRGGARRFGRDSASSALKKLPKTTKSIKIRNIMKQYVRYVNIIFQKTGFFQRINSAMRRTAMQLKTEIGCFSAWKVFENTCCPCPSFGHGLSNTFYPHGIQA